VAKQFLKFVAIFDPLAFGRKREMERAQAVIDTERLAKEKKKAAREANKK
jgi:hypothetical protein